MDALLQLGVAGASLFLLLVFIKGILRLADKHMSPLVTKHIETMDNFQRNQLDLTGLVRSNHAENREEHGRIAIILNQISERLAEMNAECDRKRTRRAIERERIDALEKLVQARAETRDVGDREGEG